MSRPSIFALAGVALALTGCGSSSNSTSSSAATAAPTNAATTTPAGSAFLAPLKTVSTLASTIPANGDVNPYGIVLVPSTAARSERGRLLSRSHRPAWKEAIPST